MLLYERVEYEREHVGILYKPSGKPLGCRLAFRAVGVIEERKRLGLAERPDLAVELDFEAYVVEHFVEKALERPRSCIGFIIQYLFLGFAQSVGLVLPFLL